MSLSDCINRGVEYGLMDGERGKRAQALWKDLSDRYERQGHPRHVAESLAAEDVKEAFTKEAGEIRHVFLARISNLRQIQARVENAGAPDMIQNMERLDYQHRGLVRRFNARLAEFLGQHGRDILGNTRNPAQMRNIVRELHGEASGDAAAKALADGIRETLEDMRLMFNSAGGLSGKMDNWGLPHSHSRRAVTKAGFDRWSQEIAPRLDWSRIEDPLTGRPMAESGAPDAEVQERFLREVYDNIAFGKESREAVYGKAQGIATYRKHSEQRVLHFRSADDWIDYNRDFGTGDPFASLMGHVHRMARDITLMREYGPNPGLGVDYESQLWQKKARDAKSEKLERKVASDSAQATRMFRILAGGSVPQTAMQDWMATFFSSARHVMTSAFLDRAIIASISDINSMRLAAQSIGMNPGNLVSRHVDLMASSMSRADAARAGWVADTLADAGTALARFQQEWAPSEIAERLSSASMRVQGLTHWTDQARAAFQMEMAGFMAANSKRSLDKVDAPLQKLLTDAGVTAKEWDNLRKPEHLFKAGNGATFLSPFWWREATDLPTEQADEIFFKLQGLVEEQMEFAVPTQSLLARGAVDPAGRDLPPGSLLYEVAKSGLMFKSFAMTFSVNQYRRLSAQPTMAGKIGYGLNLAAGATILGALSLQIGDIALGRDPQTMTDASFWGRATLKGGGFGLIGDIVSTGEASWGGGFSSYIAGPVPQLANDAWGLTVGNAWEFATGQDTNFAKELSRTGRRYTPMGQTPAIGPAMDRLFWDQLQLLLDPESISDMQMAAKRRANLYSNDAWWMPGEAAPSRAPDLSNIF